MVLFFCRILFPLILGNMMITLNMETCFIGRHAYQPNGSRTKKYTAAGGCGKTPTLEG